MSDTVMMNAVDSLLSAAAAVGKPQPDPALIAEQEKKEARAVLMTPDGMDYEPWVLSVGTKERYVNPQNVTRISSNRS